MNWANVCDIGDTLNHHYGSSTSMKSAQHWTIIGLMPHGFTVCDHGESTHVIGRVIGAWAAMLEIRKMLVGIKNETNWRRNLNIQVMHVEDTTPPLNLMLKVI